MDGQMTQYGLLRFQWGLGRRERENGGKTDSHFEYHCIELGHLLQLRDRQSLRCRTRSLPLVHPHTYLLGSRVKSPRDITESTSTPLSG